MSLTYGPPRCADCGREIKNGAQRCKPCQREHAAAWRRAYQERHAERLRAEAKARRSRRALASRERA